jgi:outer membrane protein assembly factor BamE (lipoprotein component of BamABCDE complex)
MIEQFLKSMKRLYLASVLLIFLTACSTMTEPNVISTPMRVGMTKQQLRNNFGSPLSVVTNADGSEEWFYHFGSRGSSSGTHSEITHTPSGQSVTTTSEATTTLTYSEAAVHLSPEGVVTSVPSGQVVIR